MMILYESIFKKIEIKQIGDSLNVNDCERNAIQVVIWLFLDIIQ